MEPNLAWRRGRKRRRTRRAADSKRRAPYERMRLLSNTPCSASLSLAGSLRTASRLTSKPEALGATGAKNASSASSSAVWYRRRGPVWHQTLQTADWNAGLGRTPERGAGRAGILPRELLAGRCG